MDKKENTYLKSFNQNDSLGSFSKTEVSQFVTDVYKAAFGREPEAEGQAHWENVIKNKTVKAQEFVKWKGIYRKVFNNSR